MEGLRLAEELCDLGIDALRIGDGGHMPKPRKLYNSYAGKRWYEGLRYRMC